MRVKEGSWLWRMLRAAGHPQILAEERAWAAEQELQEKSADFWMDGYLAGRKTAAEAIRHSGLSDDHCPSCGTSSEYWASVARGDS